MSQNVMITGAGKAVGLGFNMVVRYLEAWEGNTKYMDNVSAFVQQINGNPYMRKMKPYLQNKVLQRTKSRYNVFQTF